MTTTRRESRVPPALVRLRPSHAAPIVSPLPPSPPVRRPLAGSPPPLCNTAMWPHTHSPLAAPGAASSCIASSVSWRPAVHRQLLSHPVPSPLIICDLICRESIRCCSSALLTAPVPPRTRLQSVRSAAACGAWSAPTGLAGTTRPAPHAPHRHHDHHSDPRGFVDLRFRNAACGQLTVVPVSNHTHSCGCAFCRCQA